MFLSEILEKILQYCTRIMGDMIWSKQDADNVTVQILYTSRQVHPIWDRFLQFNIRHHELKHRHISLTKHNFI